MKRKSLSFARSCNVSFTNISLTECPTAFKYINKNVPREILDIKFPINYCANVNGFVDIDPSICYSMYRHFFANISLMLPPMAFVSINKNVPRNTYDQKFTMNFYENCIAFVDIGPRR